MSDTKQIVEDDSEYEEPLRAELRLVFVGSNRIQDGPPWQLKDQKKFTIGRKDSCDIWLDDDTASEQHASVHSALTASGWQVELRDSGSSNGTIVNGQKVKSRFLEDSDVIRIGSSFLVFRVHRFSDEDGPIPDLIGCSPAMRFLRRQIVVFAPTSAVTLIQGESGVGKEVAAQALHTFSRRKGPLVTTNCATIEKSLADSTLFGHVKGAFTGAIEDHKGLFQRAMQGSLFLDEVGELDAPVQAKLLRAVDTLRFSPLGAQTEIKTDARVIAATKVDLQQAVQQSRFRDDLYFRLSGIRLHIPPLRDRREDILLLAQYFIRQKNPKATISTGLAAALLEYSFPGNVRELKSLIDKALAVAASRSSTELKRSYCKDELEEKATSLRGIPDTSMLHETDRPVQPAVPEEEQIKGRPSKEELEAILVRCDWKILRVSKLTQWDRHTIRRWMKLYGLTAP